MPPKADDKPKKLTKKQKAKLKEEQLQREEEERAAQRAEMQQQEAQRRGDAMLMEKTERTELRLLASDAQIASMVSKKAHYQLQAQFTELSKTSSQEKAQLEKQLAQLTRAKDALEKDLNELKALCKTEAAELALIKKKLEGEMSSHGTCFVCVECARTCYNEQKE
eukprot:NODE_897_length_1129_cov_88.966068_g855_i0.p1 GENE.NODE_897_length_1129_cov_88.966068_g855_i0~~NODE_897_length_1129_cov_88.966068_g855_i0.p1  ORF type:complete len:166 (+),score=42.62 NODE_897_length_1129_cov_88.966068_g855_i0:60-557(+)